MPSVVVVGAQWGDEGKGKVVDLLAAHADLVVRFHGGNNAGHTVVIKDETFILHLVPAGVLHPGKCSVIGNGSVVDPEVLVTEVGELKRRGYLQNDAELVVSELAHVIMPYHRRIDQAREARKGKKKIGTTGRGIGPAYEDKAARIGIRMGDLLDGPSLKAKIHDVLEEKNPFLERVLGAEGFRFEELYDATLRLGEKVAPYVRDTSTLVDEAARAGKNLLFEGAQGVLLDLDHGTYPYVTSSNTVAGNAAVGAGVAPGSLDAIIGITKAYATRVGEGPFLTELHDEVGNRLREEGKEFGATTGRPRRCGWLDGVALRYSARISGLTGLAITKLDILRGLDSIRVCSNYALEGKPVASFPPRIETLSRCVPVYEEWPGWNDSIRKIRSRSELPRNVDRYVRRIEELAGVPALLLSLGAERDQTILLENPFRRPA